MNNSGAELSSYFMWILVQKNGMQFHIVQKHGSASMAVLRKKKEKMKVGEGGDACCFILFFFFISSHVASSSSALYTKQSL